MKINGIIHYNKLGNGLKDVLLDIELSSDEKNQNPRPLHK